MTNGLCLRWVQFLCGTRRIVNAVFLLFILLILTSCIDVKQRIQFNADGGGTAVMEIAAEPMYGKEILHDIKRQAPRGWTMVQEGEKDGKNAVVFERKFQNIEELSDDQITYQCIRGTKFGILNTLSLRIQHLKSSELPFPFEILVKMPGGIDETSGVRVSSREARWSMRGFNKGDMFTVEASSVSFIVLMVGFVVIICVLGGIIIMASSQTKKRKRIPVTTVTPSRNGTFCAECGAKNTVDSAFCVECGAKIDK